MWLQIVLVFLAIYLWFRNRYNYWNKIGFPSVPGTFPFGSSPNVGTKEHTSDFLIREYDKMKDKEVAFGIYTMAKPNLIPTDPELIKDILVTRFDIFHERGLSSDPNVDPLSQHLMFKNGQEWKELRSKLSPTFTSANMISKLPKLIQKADRMVEFLQPLAENDEPLEMTEFFSCFTIEMIMDVLFGVETRCFGDPKNEFRRITKVMSESSPMRNLKFAMLMSFERLSAFLNIGFNNDAAFDLFVDTFTEVIKSRRELKVDKSDFLQLLINISDISLNDTLANCFLFFFAG